MISRRQGKISAESLFVVLSVVGAAVVITGTTYARAHGIPRLEARQLGEVAYTASCRVDRCEVSLEAKTTRGGPISIPETSTLTFECGDDTPRFTIFAASLSGDIALNRRCPTRASSRRGPRSPGCPQEATKSARR